MPVSSNVPRSRLPSNRLVILGAGRNISGDLPSAVVRVDPNHRVLDWLIAGFQALPDTKTCFVGGYRIDLIEEAYPDISFFFNPDWATTGPAKSLALVPLSSSSSTFIAYADVLFRPEFITRLAKAEGDLVLAVDRVWRNRYESRSSGELAGAEKVRMNGSSVFEVGKHLEVDDAEAEFAGLLRLSPDVAQSVHALVRSGKLDPRSGIPQIINFLIRQGISARTVDVAGQWSELNAPQDLGRFVLGTKAESLERLRPLVRRGRIGEQVSFTESEWTARPDDIVEVIRTTFSSSNVIVRSSALSEDTWLQSSAGVHESILNIPTKDAEALRSAIEQVVGSYAKRDDFNQVLVQKMLEDVVCNGVIMTRTPTLASPYYVINFDDTTDRTDSVTAGTAADLRTIFLHRGAPPHDGFPQNFHILLEAVREIEDLVGHDSLDIEFAFTSGNESGEPVAEILQIRPIAVAHRDQPIDDVAIGRRLESAHRYFVDLSGRSPVVLGQSTQLSVMTDWNPAEMIGTKPNRLAFSLYRRLITDETWAIQRQEYGYRDVRPAELIVDLLGHPYIDVRVDFNSFVPACLSDSLAERLVDHYLDRLRSHPELHDKVEFDILFTCLDFDFDNSAQRLRDDGFSANDIEELRAALVDITKRGIERCARDREGFAEFDERYERICATAMLPLERAYLLLEEVRIRGVLIFSHLARGAFVAVALLRSLERVGVLSVEQVETFLASLRTVPSAMQQHASDVATGELEWESFIKRYGHLRPGSYDISSPRYDSAPEQFLRPMVKSMSPAETGAAPRNVWDPETQKGISAGLERLGLAMNSVEFEKFLRTAIEGREFGKFSFTRNLSRALEEIAEFGSSHGLDRDDMSMIPIDYLFSLRGAPASGIKDELIRAAQAGRDAMFVTQAVCLPGQIFDVSDLRSFEQLRAEPNYVTRKKIRAQLVVVSAHSVLEADLSGKIALVPSADPGFDWLFSSDLAGLITMYGGVNSHMAIRAAEFELPAAIGIGEHAYEGIKNGRMIELDCASRKIQVLH